MAFDFIEELHKSVEDGCESICDIPRIFNVCVCVCACVRACVCEKKSVMKHVAS